MKSLRILFSIGVFVCSCAPSGLMATENSSANQHPIIKVWPATAPGVVEELKPRIHHESGTPQVAGAPIQLLTDISSPELVYFRANAQKNAPVVIICPGGGHNLLAYDLEGTELANWLNKLQINAVVLKYRVPSKNTEFRGLPALQDAQRSIRVVRSKADELGIDPNQIGIMGFSAGGEVAARAALQFHTNHYEPIDEVDAIDARPNFAMLIYPAYLVEKDELKPEVDPRNHPTPAELPPFFLVHTWDDPVTPLSSICLAKALKQVDRPCELHLFDRGGHGYGIRYVAAAPVTTWTAQAEKWLKLQSEKPPAN